MERVSPLAAPWKNERRPRSPPVPVHRPWAGSLHRLALVLRAARDGVAGVGARRAEPLGIAPHPGAAPAPPARPQPPLVRPAGVMRSRRADGAQADDEAIGSSPADDTSMPRGPPRQAGRGTECLRLRMAARRTRNRGRLTTNLSDRLASERRRSSENRQSRGRSGAAPGPAAPASSSARTNHARSCSQSSRLLFTRRKYRSTDEWPLSVQP
jgi:hypothetical protein